MNDVEYDALTDELLIAVEEAVEQLDLDIDSESHGGLLTLIFPDRSKIVINKQPPLQQMWVATKFNGHHFEFRSGQWIDNRGGLEFWQLLSEAASQQAGVAITLTAPV